MEISKIIEIYRKHNYSNENINDILITIYEDIIKHKFMIIAHFYYIIDYYKDNKGSEDAEGHKNHNKTVLKYMPDYLKKKCKKWVMDLYYDNKDSVVSKSKEFVVNLLKPYDITNIDFNNYDYAKILETINYLELDFNNSNNGSNNNKNIKSVMKKTETTKSEPEPESESEQQVQEQEPEIVQKSNTEYLKNICGVCYTVPCCCSQNIKCSFSDYKNISNGPTGISSTTDHNLIKYHNKTKYQQKYDNNTEEVEFVDHCTKFFNFSKTENEKIKSMWRSYKDSKIREFSNIKIRNKNIHYLYVVRLVTCVPYDKIMLCITNSFMYKKIQIDMLCNNETNKLNSNIEISFDKYFSSFESLEYYEFKNNHENNKKLKVTINKNIYNNLIEKKTGTVLTLSEKIDKIKRKIDYEIINGQINKNIIYEILKNEGIKITKKEVDTNIIKYY